MTIEPKRYPTICLTTDHITRLILLIDDCQRYHIEYSYLLFQAANINSFAFYMMMKEIENKVIVAKEKEKKRRSK